MILREVSHKDYKKIKELFKRNNLNMISRGRWKNLWLKNPILKKKKKKWVKGRIIQKKKKSSWSCRKLSHELFSK